MFSSSGRQQSRPFPISAGAPPLRFKANKPMIVLIRESKKQNGLLGKMLHCLGQVAMNAHDAMRRSFGAAKARSRPTGKALKINRSASSSPGGQRGGARSFLEPNSPKGSAIGVRHFAWFVIAAQIPVAMAALKFGRRFLVQFFVSPFQFFILVPWLLAFFSLKTGIVPREKD